MSKVWRSFTQSMRLFSKDFSFLLFLAVDLRDKEVTKCSIHRYAEELIVEVVSTPDITSYHK